MSSACAHLIGSDCRYGQTVKRPPLVAVCYSDRCNTKNMWRGATGGKIIMKASRSMDWCPHCGHALVWESQNKFSNTKREKV